MIITINCLNETVLVNLIWIVPLLILIFAYAGFRRNLLLRRMAGVRMLDGVKAELSRKKRFLKSALIIISVCLCVAALARPAWNPQEISTRQKGRGCRLFAGCIKEYVG